MDFLSWRHWSVISFWSGSFCGSHQHMTVFQWSEQDREPSDDLEKTGNQRMVSRGHVASWWPREDWEPADGLERTGNQSITSRGHKTSWWVGEDMEPADGLERTENQRMAWRGASRVLIGAETVIERPLIYWLTLAPVHSKSGYHSTATGYSLRLLWNKPRRELACLIHHLPYVSLHIQ